MIIIYDIIKVDFFKNVARWIEDVKKYVLFNVFKLLVGNKIDIEESREVSIEEVRLCVVYYSMIDVLEVLVKVREEKIDVFYISYFIN